MYKRPSGFVNVVNGLVRTVTRLGVSPGGAQSLTLRGRTSGESRSVPVNPLELGGETYLVSPRGTSNWVRNLRAAGEGELRVGRTARRFHYSEVLDEQKLPILRAYLERWAGQTQAFFEADAGASDERLREIAPLHPVFRLSFE